MRISFKMDGGLAAVPGLRRPILVDTDALSAEQRAEIERLFAAAGFFDQPAARGGPHRGAADVRTYTVTAEDAGRSHTIERTEPIDDPALGEIIDWLRSQRHSSP